ncbi:hypothetical protein L3X38_010959 [Prunus dulcis]|uniref:Uncharacterized protein n=1 Tax=Prunus dulcis TaxID=3755 RepID=A0AAD4WGI1_PRUDU|nr:hypothetical protein L3X38_010959 [Prunus dulcis]
MAFSRSPSSKSRLSLICSEFCSILPHFDSYRGDSDVRRNDRFSFIGEGKWGSPVDLRMVMLLDAILFEEGSDLLAGD